MKYIVKLFKALRRAIVKHQWFVILMLGSASFLLGCAGFKEYYKADSQGRTLWDYVYLSLQMFALQIGDMPGPKSWEFHLSRLLSPAIAAYAVLLAIASIFYQQISLLKLKWLYKKHVIICGLGEKGSMLATRFLKEGKKVVIIEPDNDNEYIDHFRDEGAIVINGNANDISTLVQARALSAAYLIAISGDDGINTEIAVQINELTKKSGSSLSSFIHISDNKLCNFFQMNGFQISEKTNSSIEFFNFFHIGSKLLMNKYPVKNNKEKNESQHILIIGLGKIGENILIDASRSWQKIFIETGNRLKVSIIDTAADHKLNMLKARIHKISEICDIKSFQFNIESEEFLKADFLLDENRKCIIDKIYICLDVDSKCMYSALHLSNFISALVPSSDVPIIVKMNNSRGLGAVLKNQNYENREAGVFKNVEVFSFLEETCTPKFVITGNYERLARAFHTMFVNKKKKESNISHDDPSIAPWDKLNEYYRNNNLLLARNVFIVLKGAGYKVSIQNDWEANVVFSDGDIVEMASKIHNLWVNECKNMGWKFASGPKNEKLKTNPNLIDFKDLSDKAKEFDLDAIKALPSLLNKIGIQINCIKKA